MVRFQERAIQHVHTLDETDAARALLYRLLGAFFSAPPTAALLARSSRLGGDGALGASLRDLAAKTAALTETDARTEYDALLIGVARGEVVPYASFYLTGFLHERPLARLRADMARLGFAGMSGRSEPEDHIASICEMMASLIESGQSVSAQAQFFEAHLARWAAAFFDDLRAAPSARLYATLATLGRFLIDLDREAFALADEHRGAA